MNKRNSIEAIDKTNFSEQTKFLFVELSKLRIILSNKLMKENHTAKNYVNILLVLITWTRF